MSSLHDAAVAAAAATLVGKLQADGMPRYVDDRMAVVHAALELVESPVEVLRAYWLDTASRLIAIDEIARGTADAAEFSLTQVGRLALARSAAAVVLVHCHPCGDPAPSDSDIASAERIDRQMATLGILPRGHYVVALDGYADIRNNRAYRYADIAGATAGARDLPRCPHCHGVLESDV